MHSSITIDPRDAARGSAPAKSPYYVLFLAMVAAISGFLFGFDTAVINGALLFLRHQFGLSNLETEVAASSLLLGCLLGAAGASLIGDRYGRRRSLIAASLLFALSTIGTSLANSVTVFSFGRLVGGLAIGLASVLTPVYISEVAPARNRGALVSMNQLAIVVGILVAYVVSWKLALLGEVSWRWMMGVAAIPSFVFLLGLLVIPESPRWLISHGQRDKGEAVLARIFGKEEATAQVASVETASVTEEGSWREVFSQSMRRPLIIAIALAVLCQITGINTVLYYGSIIINEHFKGATSDTALLANVVIGATNLASTLIAFVLIDRWGRRTLLLVATAGMTVSLCCLVLSLQRSTAPAGWLLGSVIGFVASFALGLGPVPWIVISEIFPNKIRGRAASLATSALWTSTLIVTFTFLSMVRSFGVAGTFAFYALLSFVGFVYIWKSVPETRGKTLEQIQHEWESTGKVS